MRLVNLALEPTVTQGDLGHGRGRAGSAHKHHIGLGRHDLEDLGLHAGVRTAITLGGHDLHLALGCFGQGLEQQLAPGIRETNETDRLGPTGHHVGHHAVDHQVGRGLTAKHKSTLVATHIQRRHRHHRRFLGIGHIGHGHGGTDQVGAQDHIDLVLRNQLARALDGIGRVGRIVQNDVIDLFTTNLGRQQIHGLFGFGTERGGRSGQRSDDTHVDVGHCRHHHQRGGGQGHELVEFHDRSPRGKS